MYETIDKYKAEIENLYKSGYSVRKVALTLNLKSGTVGSYIKSIGISRVDFKGKNNPFYGKKHSEEFCKTHSLFMKNRVPKNKGWQKHSPSKFFSGAIINKWKVNAFARDIEWNISYDQLDQLWEKQNGLCALTGKPMIPSNKGNKMTIASLDRIDNSIGYKDGNVQLVLGILNICKNILHNDEFINMCKEVVKHVTR